jgi:homoserine kinase
LFIFFSIIEELQFNQANSINFVVAVPNETLEPSEARQLLAKERKQRDHFLGLNHFLVEELKEKSKMVAGQPSAGSKRID